MQTKLKVSGREPAPQGGRGGGLFVLMATLTRLRSGVLERIVDLTGLEHLMQDQGVGPAFVLATPSLAMLATDSRIYRARL